MSFAASAQLTGCCRHGLAAGELETLLRALNQIKGISSCTLAQSVMDEIVQTSSAEAASPLPEKFLLRCKHGVSSKRSIHVMVPDYAGNG